MNNLHIGAVNGDNELITGLLDRGADIEAKYNDGWTALHYSAGNGHNEVVTTLLARGSDIEAKAPDGRTALHYSACIGHKEVVTTLLDRGSNIEAKDNDGWTALHCSANSGHNEVVTTLLDRGSDIEASTIGGLTAMHYSARNGHNEVVTTLLDRGSDIEATSNGGWRALHYSAHNGHNEALTTLLDRGSDIEAKTNDGWTPLHYGACYGYNEVVTTLLDRGADFEATTNDGLIALHYSASNGHKEVVTTLLDRWSDIEATTNDGWTALHYGACYGYNDVVTTLLDRGSDIKATTNDGWTALHYSASSGHNEVVTTLLARGSDIDAKTNDGLTALHYSARNDHNEVVTTLVDRGSDIKVTTNGGWTALHYSAISGHNEVMSALLDRRTDTEAKDFGLHKALHDSAETGGLAVVQTLLERQADPQCKIKGGWTPLQCAVTRGNQNVISALLNAGADINVRQGNNWGLLHSASFNGEINRVDTLLKHGADPNLLIKSDANTPLHLATKNGHIEIMTKLIQNKADINTQNLTGQTALHVACQYNKHAALCVLLEARSNVDILDKKGQTAMYLASDNGKEENIKSLLEHNVNCNIGTQFGITPLGVAAQKGHVDIVKMLLPHTGNTDILHLAVSERRGDVIQTLLQAGVSQLTRDEQGRTPLHLAVEKNYVDVILLLLQLPAHSRALDCCTALQLAVGANREYIATFLLDECGESVNETDEQGRSLLHIAAETDAVQVARFLLNRGVDTDAKDGECNTPLFLAALNNNVKVAQLLIDRGAETEIGNARDDIPLFCCCQRDSIDVVKLLLTLGGQDWKTIDGNGPLHICAVHDSVKVAAFLIEHSVDITDVNEMGNTALHVCAQNNSLNVASVLLRHNALSDVKNKDEETPLHLAVKDRSWKVACVLVRLDSDWNMEGMDSFTALHWAVAADNMEVAKVLLKMTSTDVNATDSKGRTPLHISAIRNCEKVVELLVTNGASLLAEDTKGQPPMFVAYMYQNDSVFKLLSRKNINVVDREGQHIYHLAARLDDSDTLLQLITSMGQRKSCATLDDLIDMRNTNGDTPLHVAVVEESPDVVDLLLKSGANGRIANSSGKTPIDFARDKWSMFYMLQEAELGNGIKFTGVYPSDIHISNLFKEMSALHVAVMQQKLDFVHSVLQKGADPNMQDAMGRNAMHYATSYRSVEITQLLIKLHPQMNAQDRMGRTPIHYAAKYNRAEQAKLLLENGADIRIEATDFNTPLHLALAVRLENEEDYEENVSLFGELLNALQEAFTTTECMRIVASAIALLIMNSNEPFWKSRLESVIWHLTNETTPLAASNTIPPREHSLQSILYGTPCFVSNQLVGLSKRTCGIWSKDTVLSAVVKTLKSNELRDILGHLDLESVNSTNFIKQSALHLLADITQEDQDAQMVMEEKARILVERGADVKLCDINKRTVLHLACRCGNVRLSQYIVDVLGNGGDSGQTASFLNLEDNFGRRAVHYLIKYCDALSDNTVACQLLKQMVTYGGTVDSGNMQAGICIFENAYVKGMSNIAYGNMSRETHIPQIGDFHPPYTHTHSLPSDDIMIPETDIEGWICSLKQRYPDSNAFVQDSLNSDNGPLTNTPKSKVAAGRMIQMIKNICVGSLRGIGNGCAEGDLELGGSMSEGTKVGGVDEMDFLFRLKDHESRYEVADIDGSSGSPFAILTDQNDNKKLDAESLALDILRAFLDSLKQKDLPKLGISVEDVKRNKLKVFTLVLSCEGSLGDDRNATVDIVPSIVKDFVYDKNKTITVSQEHVQTTSADQTSRVNAPVETRLVRCPLLMKKEGFEISFSEMEHEAIRKLSETERKGYMLLKVMRSGNICPRLSCMRRDMDTEDVLPSYIFKMALLWMVNPEDIESEYEVINATRDKFKADQANSDDDIVEIRKLALAILNVLTAVNMDALPCYFCPSSKLRLSHNCKLLCQIMKAVLE